MTLGLGPGNHGQRKSSWSLDTAFLPTQPFCSAPCLTLTCGHRKRRPGRTGRTRSGSDRSAGRGVRRGREQKSYQPDLQCCLLHLSLTSLKLCRATKPARQAPPSPVPVAEAPSPRPARETGACDWTRLPPIILKNFSWLAG